MTDYKTLQPGDPAHLVAAFSMLGLKEIVGGEHEPEVVQFFADAGHGWVKDDETAWCAAFAHAMLGRAGIEGTGSLAARSYEKWGEPTNDPQRGDVVIFKRGNQGWQGHVAFFLRKVGTRIWVIGGNQSNAVTVASYSESSLLGYRRPPAGEGVPAGVIPRPAPSRPVAASAALIEQVQLALIAKGYHEVGKPDGIYGSKTRGAILAFEADHTLPLSGAVTPEIWEAINRAEPREVDPERAAGKPKGNPAVKANTANVTVGSILTGGAVIGVVEPIVSTVEGGAGLVARVRVAFEPIIDLWPLLALAAGVAVIWFAIQSRKAVVDDYRAGRLTN